MKKIHFLLPIFIIFLLTLNSCGTVFIKAGVNRNVAIKISGTPEDASISVNGNTTTNNSEYTIPSINKKPCVKISKEGYITESILMKRNVRPGILGLNVVCGCGFISPLFLLVDHFTGGLYKLKNRELKYKLKPKP